MPIYSFTCCNKTVEKLQKVADPAPPCETCQKPMQKLLTAPGGFQLIGGGYYKPGFNK